MSISSFDWAGGVPERNRDGYALTYVLESGLRAYITTELESNYGPSWRKQRVPEDVRQSLRAGIEDARSTGWTALVPVDPLSYADFPDLQKLLLQRNNWRDIFRRDLHDEVQVDGFLRAAQGPRNSLAHSRPISETQFAVLRASVAFFTDNLGLERFMALAMSAGEPLDMRGILQSTIQDIATLANTCNECAEVQTSEEDRKLLRTRYFYGDLLGSANERSIRDFYDAIDTYRAFDRSKRGGGLELEVLLQRLKIDERAAAGTAAIRSILGE
jgi:hypothetical protein